MSVADGFAKEAGAHKLGKLNELLERSGIDPDDISRVERVNLWQGFLKDADGEAEVVDLAGISLVPRWAEGPEWPVVQQAAPTKVRSLPAANPSKTDARQWMILPDPQIGYRRLADGTMDPIHDERAMACAMQIMRWVKPTAVVNLGDTMDLAEWSSKFLVQPEFVLTTQATLDRTHHFLADQRANCPEDAEIWKLPGNHDDRLGIAIARNAMAALRLRPGGSPPDTWPVLSLPFLLRLDDLGVRLAGNYPAGRVKIAEGTKHQAPLFAIHGKKLDVVKVAKSSRQSYVQGHLHRVVEHNETYELDGERLEVSAWSPGCLCRIDGGVPSTNSAADDFGVPVPIVENWQHAVAVVTVQPDGYWTKEVVRIHDGRAVFRGREFVTHRE